jgi:hypothetical protein
MGFDSIHSRRNGLDRPYNPLQILAWFVMLFNISLSLCLVAPLLPLPEMIVFLILFLVSKAVLIYYGYVATISDPTDVVVNRHRAAIANEESFE